MTPIQWQPMNARAMELLREIVNLSLPRDVAGHPAVIEARELTGCGQAMGVAPLTPEQTRRFEAALQEAAAQGFAAPDPAEAMLGTGILAHAFVNSESIPGRCDTCGLTASAARHRLAPVDPAWPTHDENGNKPPAAQDPGPVCRVCGQPNTPEHQEYEAAMASAKRAVAVLPDRG